MSATTISASDLRTSLCIGFQPSITSRPELLAEVIENLGRQFAEAGVTFRRLRNAAGATNLETEYFLKLLRVMDRVAAERLGSVVADAIGADSVTVTTTDNVSWTDQTHQRPARPTLAERTDNA
jgi:hypothetical protein